MRNDGKLGIAFNNKMLLPDDFLEIIAENKRRYLEGSEQSPLIEIQSVAGEDSNVDQLGLDWKVTEVNEHGMDFKLAYADPLEVSQNDQPDKVKVRFNLGQFTDEYG